MRERIYKVAVLAAVGLGTFLLALLVGLWLRGWFA